MTLADLPTVLVSAVLLAGATLGSRTRRWGERSSMSGRSSVLIRVTFAVTALLLINWRFGVVPLPSFSALGLVALCLVGVVLSYRRDIGQAPKA